MSASDEMEEIGNGAHERTVINLRSFNERLAKKASVNGGTMAVRGPTAE